MNDVVSYIFNRLKAADVDLREINKALRTQACINCLFVGLTWFVVAEWKKQRDEILKLTAEVEELKEKKGE